MRISSLLAGLALTAMISWTSPSNAAVYDFVFTGGVSDPGISATGSFTTNAANDTVISGSGTFIFPTLGTSTANLLPGQDFSGALSYDNIFPITDNGLVFQSTTDPNLQFNIFSLTGSPFGAGSSRAEFAGFNGSFLPGSVSFDPVCSNCASDGSIVVTAEVPAVPEVSTWIMLLLGFLGMGALMGRRRVTAACAIG